MDTQPSALPSPAGTSFADRIQLLIDHVGSAAQVGRMCGFSEGVIRSWRDGNSDPSRARCVSLARTFNISLIWLITGEGPMQVAPQTDRGSACDAGMVSGGHAPIAAYPQHQPVRDAVMDAPRLNTAVRILQSAFELSGNRLDLSENTDALIELYEILGPGGGFASSSAMVDFNLRLAERIKQRSQRLADTAPKAA
jgi:hypothetical protein